MIFTRISQDCEEMYMVMIVLKCNTQSTASKQCVVSLLWYIKLLNWATQRMKFHSARHLCPAAVKYRFLPTASTTNLLIADTVDQFNSQCLLNTLHLIYSLNMIQKVAVLQSCHCVCFPQSGWKFHSILAGGGYVPLRFWHSHLQHLAAGLLKLSGVQPGNLSSILHALFTCIYSCIFHSCFVL